MKIINKKQVVMVVGIAALSTLSLSATAGNRDHDRDSRDNQTSQREHNRDFRKGHVKALRYEDRKQRRHERRHDRRHDRRHNHKHRRDYGHNRHYGKHYRWNRYARNNHYYSRHNHRNHRNHESRPQRSHISVRDLLIPRVTGQLHLPGIRLNLNL